MAFSIGLTFFRPQGCFTYTQGPRGIHHNARYSMAITHKHTQPAATRCHRRLVAAASAPHCNTLWVPPGTPTATIRVLTDSLTH